ncbi:MAG: efflux RND transporter periplasmic adaptor subunit [Verrucomicrobia bacterium]|jgi:membrane fusion protein (multidrug efflux system)|nr:MAG: efflux RND transporter periplasmic adaptor subunit [Verrucomicrobiota bacterium]
MFKQIILGIIVVVVVMASLTGIKALQIGKLIAFGKSFKQPAETVSSSVVKEENWPDTLPTVGSITAVQGVKITAEIPGTVRKIAFESGAAVEQGDLLLSMDVTTEEAQLRSLEAQTELAKTNLGRVKRLREEKTVSQADLDQAEATLKQTQANADAVRAAIAKKVIRAPFAGRLGIRQVNVGQYLEPGKLIVSLQSLSPVYGDFSLPQQEFARIKPGLTVRAKSDTYPDKEFAGKITAINPDLDAMTRSIRVQATFENPEQSLRPGMFTRMEIVFAEERGVLTIPSTSILSAPYGDSVYVIEPSTATNAATGDLVVRQQFVRVGNARGDFISITTGLKAGQKVVTSGIFKLRNGGPVVENNSITPASSKKPNPSDS